MLLGTLFYSGCVQDGTSPPENKTIEDVVSVSESQTTTTTSSIASTTTSLVVVSTLPPSSTAPSTTTLPAVGSGRVQVVIMDQRFIPENLTIRAETIVTWVNNDSSEHQIISDVGFAGKTGGFSRQISDLKSSRMFKGSTYSYRFRRSGNFTYHCNIYPSVRGSIEVLP